MGVSNDVSLGYFERMFMKYLLLIMFLFQGCSSAVKLDSGDCFRPGPLENWQEAKYKTYMVIQVGQEKYLVSYLYRDFQGNDTLLDVDFYKTSYSKADKVACPKELADAVDQASLGD